MKKLYYESINNFKYFYCEHYAKLGDYTPATITDIFTASSVISFLKRCALCSGEKKCHSCNFDIDDSTRYLFNDQPSYCWWCLNNAIKDNAMRSCDCCQINVNVMLRIDSPIGHITWCNACYPLMYKELMLCTKDYPEDIGFYLITIINSQKQYNVFHNNELYSKLFT